MPRDTESIEREIEKARNQLASTLDELTVRTNPKRLVENTKKTVLAKLNELKSEVRADRSRFSGGNTRGPEDHSLTRVVEDRT